MADSRDSLRHSLLTQPCDVGGRPRTVVGQSSTSLYPEVTPMTGYIDANRPPGLLPADYNPRHKLLEAPRPIQVGWARRRRVDRDARRDEAVRGRVVDRLAKLGAGWKVLDTEELGLPTKNTFLAIGPGGVFLVTVK